MLDIFRSPYDTVIVFLFIPLGVPSGGSVASQGRCVGVSFEEPHLRLIFSFVEPAFPQNLLPFLPIRLIRVG